MQEALDLHTPLSGALPLMNILEFGQDFSCLAEPLGRCCSSKLTVAADSTTASAHMCAEVLNRMRWASTLAIALENDFISLEKERKADWSMNAALIDHEMAAAMLRQLYKSMEDEVTAAAVAGGLYPCSEQQKEEQHEQQRSMQRYLAGVMSYTRGIAQAQLAMPRYTKL
jgi:hypothetical protein